MGIIGVVKLDPSLAPFSDALKRRYAKVQQWIKAINDSEGGVEKFSRVRCLISLLAQESNKPARGRKNLASMWTTIAISSTESGHQMLQRRS